MEDKKANALRRPLLRIGIALILLGAASVAFKTQMAADVTYTAEVVPATCTDSGYTLYTNDKTGSTNVADVVAPLGHDYGEWAIIREAAGVDPAVQERICNRCEATQTRAKHENLGIAQLYLNGDLTGIGKKNEVDLTAEFFAGDTNFTAFATAKHQGHSTLAFDKKNYTVKFYSDADRTEKMKLTLSHWNPENKYILKANYQDPSQSRNLVSADLWAEITASRTGLAEELKTLSNFGAVDGFPVALYLNHEFSGLYTMNLHKDDDLFGMKDSEDHAIVIVNHTDEDEAFFRADAAFTEDSPWEIEYCGTEDDTWVRERLNGLIDFVQTADDQTFREQIGSYLDVESALDYLIAMYSLGLQEHGAKDLILVTYGQDEPWICSMYDMEEAFDTEGPYPEKDNGQWDSGTGSLLWDRILNLYYDEICSRYAQLRQDVLAPEQLTRRLEQYVQSIPWNLYEADADENDTEIFTQEKLQEMMGNICVLIEKTDKRFDYEEVRS